MVVFSSRWKRMRSGDRPGLQNRRELVSSSDGFDSHPLPPQHLSGSLREKFARTIRVHIGSRALSGPKATRGDRIPGGLQHTAVRHATRSSSRRGRNSDLRRLSISSLCFGLKTRAKTDPMPRPTMRNVIAEFKSYSLLFLASFINTPLPNQRTSLSTRKNHATFPKPLFSCLCLTHRAHESELSNRFRRRKFSHDESSRMAI
jgi:hypothetical protein